jgi:hypothetical protein
VRTRKGYGSAAEPGQLAFAPTDAKAKIGPSAFSAHTCIRLRRQLQSRNHVLHVPFTLRYYIGVRRYVDEYKDYVINAST